jgi:hypothetical protein
MTPKIVWGCELILLQKVEYNLCRLNSAFNLDWNMRNTYLFNIGGSQMGVTNVYEIAGLRYFFGDGGCTDCHGNARNGKSSNNGKHKQY